MYILFVYIVIV